MRCFIINLALELGRLPSELKQSLTVLELKELIAFHNIRNNTSKTPQARMTNKEAEDYLSELGANLV
ncbi:hypothetical protein [Pseudoalteromonas sp. S16_S37]|uniref:hypothetical protein n=1 Tax=Pseudoalteromonas sp. S16_S37 TaxID=2720228 RepID=UPI001680DBB5|nr:hypothetical protein [Pseudoalteromonas sp. S16_S37]MBD1583501.1 hypothetical protein [Pseudoalteromonas sp. S16_S37]